MSYIPKKCPDCGANLDPNETCDCNNYTKDSEIQKLKDELNKQFGLPKNILFGEENK